MRAKPRLLAGAVLLMLSASCDRFGEGPGESAGGASSSELPAASRRVGPIRFAAAPEGGHDYPSTRAIGPEDFRPPWPIVSIATDEANLGDPETGIFANTEAHGRAWERPATLSYFVDGELAFASRVGIRLHGGSTRHRRKQRRIRVYFRSEYGAEAFPNGLLFGPESQPLRTLVVRTDDQHFATPLAFDISRRIGALAPETQPALFFLNGEALGQYYLVPHQSPRQWASHLGHAGFLFYRYKSDDEAPEAYRELDRWVRNLENELTVESVGERIDLDNLSRHLFSVVFCATNDWIQGAAVLDTSRPGARWFFLNWDMDHSFVDFGAAWKLGKRPQWQQEAFELLFSHRDFRDAEKPERPIQRGDLRRVIFSRLWRDSPEYRAYFARLVMDLSNHRLDHEYLLSRLRYYRDTLGIAVPAEREDFLLRRADFVREDLKKWFELGELHEVSLDSDQEMRFEVDGYPEAPGYRGRYFAGEEVRVRGSPDSRRRVEGWRVNGEERSGPELALVVTRDLAVEPILR